MKPLFLVLLCLGLGAATLSADEKIRAVQQALKEDGFFFGDVNGEPSNELNTAIKRFQLRNGLPGTGQLTDEVVQALNLDGAPAPNPPPPSTPGAEPLENPPQPTLGRSAKIPGLDGPGPGPAPGGIDPAPSGPAARRVMPEMPPGQEPDDRLIPWLKGTPYELAPAAGQRDIIRRAQEMFIKMGGYKGKPTGEPGPALGKTIREYQGMLKMRQTGILDMATLDKLALLPGPGGRGPGGPGGPGPVSRGPSRQPVRQ
jgi:peptidoglycan hydrolase-like protein with peptidoglycan-binding domain